MRILDGLIDKGWVYRNEEERLELVEWLANCKTELVHCYE
jgi:hypothetical protein